jgi:hypothetical protein
LWYDWTSVQKEHALRDYNKVLQKLEELLQLKEDHAQVFGSSTSAWWAELTQVIDIDLGEMYHPSKMLELVENAIAEETHRFEEELNSLYEDLS